ncbi:phage baseplate upper protein, partial [Enterococcus faecalis]
YHRLEERLYTIKYGNINTLEILEDNSFSKNHEVEVVGTVNYPIEEGALIIATVDDPKQIVFTIEGVDNG